MPIEIDSFSGSNKAAEPRLLAAGVGVESTNQRPGKGDLRPWKQAVGVATVPAGRKTIYRMGADVASDALYWLTWSTVVNVIRGFDPDDTTERTYFTGSGTPKWTDNTIALAGGVYPAAVRELAVPAPLTAPNVAVRAAGDSTLTSELFFFVSTFVNSLGWESAPSPPSVGQLQPPGTSFDISGLEPAPSGAYGIDRRRIYKTKTGTSGVAEYYFQQELGIGSTTAFDNGGSLGADVLPTTGWLPPPAGAFGMTTMWNGMVSVLYAKSARICEPYEFYAYPLAYELALLDAAVAQAVWGQKLLILTTGDAYLATGSDPSGLDIQPTKIYQPCSSSRSVVPFIDGVAWASPNGLCWLGDTGFHLLTDGLIDRDPNPDTASGLSWLGMNPSTMIASRYQGFIVLFYDSGAGMKGLVIDPKKPGLYFLTQGYDAVFRDPITDHLHVYSGTTISRFDAGALMTATFRSKLIRQPEPVNFGACEVVARGYPVTVTIWVDGTQRFTRAVASAEPFTLPDGFMGEDFQVEVTTTVGSVSAVRLGLDMQDLART